MHIFFSGIGGTAIGPLALIAKQAGYDVSGSDKQDSSYIAYLRKKGLKDIHIGQEYDQIAKVHAEKPIDWFVYTSALPLENPRSGELKFCREQGIRISKRDELLNQVIKDKKLKLIAVAGTHGKTTTTAMITWIIKQLGEPVSHSVGAKISFGDMGEYQPKSEFFVYEADEFDRNFLAFEPFISVITGVTWDHHEIFPTREDYQEAFKEFLSQSKWSVIWREDAEYLGLDTTGTADIAVQNSSDKLINKITLKGLYNRLDAWLAVKAVQEAMNVDLDKLIGIINKFPGTQRRMEEIITNLYSDYAHTPEKIRGAMSVAKEMADESGQDLVVVYEPLTDRRQHHVYKEYTDCFMGAKKVYWIPSYLAREDPKVPIMKPSELIKHLSDPRIAEARERDDWLKATIKTHLEKGDMVVGMAGGGGNSLDEWLRKEFIG